MGRRGWDRREQGRFDSSGKEERRGEETHNALFISFQARGRIPCTHLYIDHGSCCSNCNRHGHRSSDVCDITPTVVNNIIAYHRHAVFQSFSQFRGFDSEKLPMGPREDSSLVSESRFESGSGSGSEYRSLPLFFSRRTFSFSLLEDTHERKNE